MNEVQLKGLQILIMDQHQVSVSNTKPDDAPRLLLLYEKAPSPMDRASSHYDYFFCEAATIAYCSRRFLARLFPLPLYCLRCQCSLNIIALELFQYAR